MTSILFTQCLQQDFVRPLERFEALPNLLHIGYSESRRLIGERPGEGPVSRVMTWAQSQSAQELQLIHLRDWHDTADEAQTAHLKRFGAHCLKDTPGAKFVFPHDPEQDPGFLVDSLSLNDFQGTQLEQILEPIVSEASRVGIMGVWTEAKVYFLAYELSTRYPHLEIAVCPALTASSSRARHFEALDQMERVLGVRVVHSVGEFVDFLGGKDLQTPLLGLHESFPEIETSLEFSDADQILLRYLFRDCTTLKIRVLDGGFSGNLVLGTQSVDFHGHLQVPHVVKIGPQELMGKERVAFERIQNVLGNNAPHISEFADYEDRGAIKYRYASMGGAFSTTFQKMVESGADQELINAVLDSVFGEQLQRLYQARNLEETDLLAHYGFSTRWAESVRSKVETIAGGWARGETLLLAKGLETPNLCMFYERDLAKLGRSGRCFQAYVHGDLNGANIIVDGHQNVWLIDFFHTRRAHVLMDLIKLENDLLYIFTKLDSVADLLSACALFDQLLEVDDLAAGLPAMTFYEEKFQRTWDTLRSLRGFYPTLIESDRSPFQWWVGALRYSAHTLGFQESSDLQKKFALYSAGQLFAKIRQYDANTRRLRVDWIPEENLQHGRLGMTILPGRVDRDRDLRDDLAQLTLLGVDSVLCMVPNVELSHYGVGDLLEQYKESEFLVHHLPVVDQKVCSLEELSRAVEWMEGELSQNRSVLVHCVGGLGRSGFAVAAYLTQRDLSPKRAIEIVRETRSPRAIETAVQESLVAEFAQFRGGS